MGYGGKVAEQQRARVLRAEAWTLADIATELGVSKSSVSLWVRDVDFVPNPRRRTRPPRVSSLHLRKMEEIARADAVAIETVGRMNDRELMLVGVALYLGEGFKRDGQVGMANTAPSVLRLFVTWLRRCFSIDESRLRVRLYLHDGLDLEAAESFWSALLEVPRSQFRTPYRALADPTRRRSKHLYGCPAVTYSHSTTHRSVMGLVRALSSTDALPG
jgi:hypothetical protein